jgi:DNA processing protein
MERRFLDKPKSFLYFIPRFRAPDGGRRLGNSSDSWIALNLALCPRSLVLRDLLECFGGPEAILAAPAGVLAGIRGMTPRLVCRLRDPDLPAAAAAERKRAEARSIRILTRDDPEFPGILLELPDPPPVLYVRGDLRGGADPGIAVVGSRRASPYGVEMARALAAEIAEAGVTVVSGLARGIDEAAHRGALEAGGRTVALLGAGMDRVYPPESRRLAERISLSGALLSEFPLGTPPYSGNFPVRNRLISGMTRGTLVVEAAPRSGSLITARLALEQGREVFAVPGNATNRGALGPNLLIQQGAKLVMRGRDILEEIPGFQPPAEREKEDAAEDDGKPDAGESILSRIPPDDPITLDELAESTGMDPGRLLAELLDLEMRDRVKPLPGGRYLRRRRAKLG